MSKPNVKFLTEYYGMHYSVYMATDLSSRCAYVFSCWKGELGHICPCCLLPVHRRDIASVIAVEANGLIPNVLTVYWLSPYRHQNGLGFGEDIRGFNEFDCCPANFISILKDELPLKIKKIIPSLK